MEWIQRLNCAIEYIEKHLNDKIDYEKVAEIANCPTYHFQRMFFYMTNISVSEYVRRRRMSLAAVDLQESGTKVIDVAMKYGYDSPTAFNRAFQSIQGIAPSLAKKESTMLKSYPAIKFSISVQGMEEMNFRIETKEAFKIVGKSCPLSKVLEENFTRIPAIFSGRGTNVSLQDLERRVITEWLPTSGYEYAEIPDIEVYIKADPNDAIYEYWLPVVKKEDK